VVVVAHHSDEVEMEKLRSDITELVIKPVLGAWFTPETQTFINSTGRFVLGGPPADTGLTGRKIIVDTYGGSAPHGGGCFSGKCITKVDRSAAYAAGYIAKNVVAAGLAKKCLIQLAYAIGVAKPVSILVDTYGTGVIPDEEIEKLVEKNFPVKPADIIEQLNLKQPIYEKTAAYGHFGRTDVEFPWEKLDKVDVLKRSL
jgi:S-adenosylmethionine synthetase